MGTMDFIYFAVYFHPRCDSIRCALRKLWTVHNGDRRGTEYPCTVVVVSSRFRTSSATQHHKSVTLAMLSDLLFLFRLVHGCVVCKMMKPTISTTTTTTTGCRHQLSITRCSSKGFVTSSFLLNLAGFARNKMRPSVIDWLHPWCLPTLSYAICLL